MARTAVLVTAAALAAVAGGAIVTGQVPCDVLELQPPCQVAMEPGPTEDTLALVSVEGTDSFEPDGELRLTTIAVRDDLTWAGWLAAVRSDVVDAVPRTTVYPPGSDRTQVAEENAALMADSQLVATIVALEQLGYDLQGEGAIVAAVTEDAVTDELVVGDVIVAVDGAAVAENGDVVAAVRAREPGARVDLEVEGEDGGVRTVTVTLGASPADPAVPYVGVLLTTRLDLPVDIAIDAGVIGGPSAGLLFALSIVELLGEDDLTDGRVIAGTGTVDRDGNVGPVGGIRQKVAGATAPGEDREPASVFLVPRGNLADAQDAAVSRDVLLVPVGTLDDAIAALDDLRAGRQPRDAQILAASR